ncbi:MAG: DUF1592 domain-containing protein [Planctomycetota bacterium]|nr:DUF1592 domain-containing protein [Planctomycetota bacterium]
MFSRITGPVSCLASLIVLGGLVPLPGTPARGEETLRSVKPFLQKYCFDCHGPAKQENEKRFDTLKDDLSEITSLERWQGILDQLNLGEMPPEKSQQPSSAEKSAVISTLTEQLKSAYLKLKSTGGQTVYRRLNRFELRNTVRDLLHLQDPELRVGNTARLVDNNGNGRVENTSTDPFRAFPNDEEIDGFDNIGDRLVMSDFFLKLMLDAAEESLDLAMTNTKRPQVEKRVFEKPIQKNPRGDLARIARDLYPEYDTFFQKELVVPDALRGGVGISAKYRITVKVSALNQKHPWNKIIIGNQEEPFRLLLRLYKSRTRNDHVPLKVFEIPADGKIRTISVTSWIEKNWLPQLGWENGPTDRETRVDQLVKQFFPADFRDPPDRKKIPDGKQYNQARTDWTRQLTNRLLKDYRGPILRVHSIELEPLIEQWPPRSHAELFGDSPLTAKQIETRLSQFARRAFRRPLHPNEILPYSQLVQSQLKGEVVEARKTEIQKLTFKGYQGRWSKLPDFSSLKPVAQGKLARGLMDIRLLDVSESFAFLFEGFLEVGQPGQFEFQMASDDGARLLINNQQVIEHDGLHGASLRKGSIKLPKGKHRFRFEYFAYGNPNSLKASWSGPGFSNAPLTVAQASSPRLSPLDDTTQKQIQALRVAYTAILCSPDFLYLQEKSGPLDGYQIASRLSYFLWSSMPDDQLFDLARSGKLTDPAEIQKQVQRMLADPRSSAFAHHFTERWLRLDKLAESPPELNGPFRIYWDRRMEPQIVAQTVAYFSDILRRNAPITEFIDSDYTFLNESIADVFYGRKDIRGDSLQKVTLNDPRRGGILVQPSVMTATANGVDTSPVVRGVWILENVLGITPPSPPPDVEPLAPDLRNAKTIRDQLAVHREQESCNRCHRKIDPLGFAFENFDPIGRWRERYPRGGKPVDPSATLANGQAIPNIVDFKKMMLSRESEVVRGLTQKLLSYASGRLLEPSDRGEVQRIVDAMDKRGNRLRDLVELVTQSKIFLNK